MTHDSHYRKTACAFALCCTFFAVLTHGVRAQETASTAPAPASPEAKLKGQNSSGPGQKHEPDTSLSRYRTAFEVLTERAIGSTARRVRYDWRRSSVQLGAHFGVPAELNNYDSLRAGGQIRLPNGNLLLSLDLSYVWVRESRSSRFLALTPYRQPGRPSRWELDFGLSYPLAEGIMTASLGFVPPTELVFSILGQLRYFVYPRGYRDLTWGETFLSIVAPRLSNKERNNLEKEQLPGMALDPARFGVLTGLGTDLYFQSGAFISVETLVAIPLLSGATDTQMLFGLELDVSVGVSL